MRRIHCGTILGGTILAAALAAASPFALSGETDVYGNEIFTYTEGGVQKTYRFWVSGDKAEDAALDNSSASRVCHFDLAKRRFQPMATRVWRMSPL